MSIVTLKQLKDVMESAHTADQFAAFGLPVAHGEPDWTSLPTFGGDEPSDTTEIWSWDADNLLVGTCADDLEITPRD